MNGATDPVPPAGIFPEHLSGPDPGQSEVTPLPSKSRRKRCGSESPLIRLKEMVSPLVTVMVGFGPDVLVKLHPERAA